MGVNYMIEINALNDWELTHPLSATAYKVLCKLYYLANKERFPERMTVSNRVLMSMVGCSEDSLIKARNQLIQSGRIDYKGQKKINPLYMIHYFTEDRVHNSVNQSINYEYPAYNSEISSYEQSIKQGIKHGIKHGYEQGIKHGTYPNDTLKEDTKENINIYMPAMGDIQGIAERIAERNGHGGNIAYTQKIVENLMRGGEVAVAAAKRELERPIQAHTEQHYTQHSYSESDFGDEFYDISRFYTEQKS